MGRDEWERRTMELNMLMSVQWPTADGTLVTGCAAIATAAVCRKRG